MRLALPSSSDSQTGALGGASREFGGVGRDGPRESHLGRQMKQEKGAPVHSTPGHGVGVE